MKAVRRGRQCSVGRWGGRQITMDRLREKGRREVSESQVLTIEGAFDKI